MTAIVDSRGVVLGDDRSAGPDLVLVAVRARARRYVTRRARDEQDAALLLVALGLDDQ